MHTAKRLVSGMVGSVLAVSGIVCGVLGIWGVSRGGPRDWILAVLGLACFLMGAFFIRWALSGGETT